MFRLTKTKKGKEVISKTLKTEDVADLFQVCTETVRRWVRKGLLEPACVVGGSYRFTEEKLQSFIKSNSF